jgi:hypothetical protein
MAISSYGSTFTTGIGEIIGEITGISFGGISCAEIDVTALIDTAKKYVLGTKDGGTIEVTCNMNATAPSLPVSGDATTTSYVIRFGTAGPSVTFSGYIVSTKMEAGVDQAVQTTYTIRISGDVTIA